MALYLQTLEAAHARVVYFCNSRKTPASTSQVLPQETAPECRTAKAAVSSLHLPADKLLS
jgi:hypothetical protein